MSTFKISDVEVLGFGTDIRGNKWTTLGFEFGGVNHRARVPTTFLEYVLPEPETYEDGKIYEDPHHNYWLYCEDSISDGEQGWTTFESDRFFKFSTPERPLKKVT